LDSLVETSTRVKKISYSDLDDDVWDDLPRATNPVESINRQNTCAFVIM